MKAYRGSRGIVPLILNLDARWSNAVGVPKVTRLPFCIHFLRYPTINNKMSTDVRGLLSIAGIIPQSNQLQAQVTVPSLG
jgi:hypothetical protein